MPSIARSVFDKIDSDVDSLLALHPAMANPGRGRPAGDTGPLLRSAIVLIHTAWENYFEQALLETSQFILASIGSDWSKMPAGLRKVAGDHAKKKDPWDLAGDGWRRIAAAHVEKRVAALNTPNSENVEELTKECLGIGDVLDGCGWRKNPPQTVRDHLNEFVHDVRGEIVHKGSTPSPLHLAGVRAWRDFFERLVGEFDAHVADEIRKEFGARPWIS
jgi:hypothetical protein